MKPDIFIQAVPDSLEINIAPGITFHRNTSFGDDPGKIEAYILQIDMTGKGVQIVVSLPQTDGTWGMRRVSELAKSAQAEGKHVAAAVNGDFYSMSSGMPKGVVIRDGEVLKESMNVGKHFFGVTRCGKAVIGDEEMFQKIKSELYTAVGGRGLLIADGRICYGGDVFQGDEVHPRSAVGIKGDGSVFFAVVDGRQPGFSEGLDLPRMAKLMKKLGAVDALNLDGGGSSTLALKLPESTEIRVINHPAEGEERPVANALLILSSTV